MTSPSLETIEKRLNAVAFKIDQLISALWQAGSQFQLIAPLSSKAMSQNHMNPLTEERPELTHLIALAQEEKANTNPPPSFAEDDVRSALVNFTKKHGRAEALKIIKPFVGDKPTKLSSISPHDYAAVIAACKNAVSANLNEAA